MKGASAGKTMYVIPYLMSPPGSPLEPYAAGVELTDHRTVVLHMIRMARVGVALRRGTRPTPRPSCAACTSPATCPTSVRAPPTTSATSSPFADERTILHFGSSYGGNALLGKIAHGLRQASYDGWASQEVPRRAVHAHRHRGQADRQDVPHLRRLPERLGQDQPGHDAGAGRARRPLQGRRSTATTSPGSGSTRRTASSTRMNPEFGVFGVAKDTNETTNPIALDSVAPGTRDAVHQRRLQRDTQEVWWEGRTPEYPGRRHRLAGLEGRAHLRPRPAGKPSDAVGPPEQPVHDDAGQRAEHRARLRGPEGRADRRASSSAGAPATASR